MDMDYYAFMGKAVLTLLVLMQFIYMIDLLFKKVVPPLKAAFVLAWPVLHRFKDQVLVPMWIKIVKKWRARK